MDLWREALERAGYPVWVFEYRYLDSIVQNAHLFDLAFQRRLAALPEDFPRRIQLVGYSQGGILLRWLLSGRAGGSWLGRVVSFIQIASPNGGCEPADLCKLLWGGVGRDSASPALEQLRPGSRLLEELSGKGLVGMPGYGVIYGIGLGRGVLGRFLAGRPEGTTFTRFVGRIYEALFVCPRANDGLVSKESALLLLAEAGMEEGPTPRRVENDHLGLLVDPETAAALVDLTRTLLGVPAL
jgi:hypothetical protein